MDSKTSTTEDAEIDSPGQPDRALELAQDEAKVERRKRKELERALVDAHEQLEELAALRDEMKEIRRHRARLEAELSASKDRVSALKAKQERQRRDASREQRTSMERILRRLNAIGQQLIVPPLMDGEPMPSEANPVGQAEQNNADIKTVVAVVSQERTASQSVYHSLRRALPRDVTVGHTHYVGQTPWRQVWNPVAARKELKELVTLRRLRNKSRRRIVFTIWRDSLERLISTLWYAHADALRERAYKYESDPNIQQTICATIDKQTKYYSLVYQRIGARGVLKKGRNDLPNGVTLYALRFSNLEDDFRAACEDAFDLEIPLLRINTADQRNDADIDDYRSFAHRFSLKDTLYFILKERYGIEREMWAYDVEPGLMGLSDKWISVMAAAVTKEAIEN
jgi:hypothetical protein